MYRRRVAASATSAPSFALLVLAFALTACSAPTSDPAGSAAPEGDRSSSGSDASDDSTTPTACVTGTWNADVDDLVAQLGRQLESTGMRVVTTRAAGTQTLTVTEDGDFRFTNDVALAVDVQMGEASVMTVAQAHQGAMTADWAWVADADAATMTFENFDDSAYTITNTVAVDGATSTTPIELPPTSVGDGRLLVTCSASTLTTKPEAGPFVTTWTR